MLMPLGSAIQAKEYTPIIVYAQNGKKCLIVLDNDQKNPEDIKNEIIKKEKEFRKTVGSDAVLNDDNFYPFPEYVYSIELYLLDAAAICKAALGKYDQTLIQNIENEINSKNDAIKSKNLKPKELLKDIWWNNRRNYEFFQEQIRKSGIDLLSLYDGINKLFIVDISLERDKDNPQLIFESLNSTGLELSQADLIRNYVLMDLEPKEQQRIYTEY
jgi:hypothetical protein